MKEVSGFVVRAVKGVLHGRRALGWCIFLAGALVLLRTPGGWDADDPRFTSTGFALETASAQRDRDAIRAGLADCTIDAICSDHAPVAEDDKLLPFGEAAPGATALETLLPLVLKWGQAAKLPLAATLARVTNPPAQILQEPTGRLAVGAKADVVIFDPQAHWTVTRAELVSRGGNTPFSGYELVGRAMLTLVGGDVRFDRKSGSESNFR